MKFPRNARIFRGQLDAAPFAGVFFLLVMFLLLTALVYTPEGVPLKLPRADNLPAPTTPTISVAMDENGRLFFDNRSIDEHELTNKLTAAVRTSAQPITLILQSDERVTEGMLVHFCSLVRQAGISDMTWATLPRPFAAPARSARP